MTEITARIADNLEGIKEVAKGHQINMWTAMPGIIQTYNAITATVSVQIAIQSSYVDDQGVLHNDPLPLLSDIPVIFPRGGGFTLTFPIVKGDECLLVFASRAIDTWWQNGGVQPPINSRLHSISDAFAIIGPMSQAKRPAGAISGSTTQLRNDSGDTYVEIASGGIVNIKAPTKIVLDAPRVECPTGDFFVAAGTIGLKAHHHTAQGALSITTPSQPDP